MPAVGLPPQHRQRDRQEVTKPVQERQSTSLHSLQLVVEWFGQNGPLRRGHIEPVDAGAPVHPRPHGEIAPNWKIMILMGKPELLDIHNLPWLTSGLIVDGSG